jgi:hypothetical protein
MSVNGNWELDEALVERSVAAARFALETEVAELGGLLKKVDGDPLSLQRSGRDYGPG